MQERLLAPLGMQRSTFNMERADRALFATHYWSGKPVSSVTVRDVPAAGLVSNVAELARFMRMLFGNGKLDGKQVLKPRSVSEMLRVQNAGVGLDLDTRVGLGWRLSGVRFPQAHAVAWLSNESPFARGRLLLVPEHRLGVIVLTNSSGATEAVEKVSERLDGTGVAEPQTGDTGGTATGRDSALRAAEARRHPRPLRHGPGPDLREGGWRPLPCADAR